MNHQHSKLLRQLRSKTPPSLAASAAVLVLCHTMPANAETWVPTVGGSWATPGNWDTSTVPNVIGALANFTPNNLANRPVTIDSGTAGFTVGSIAFDLTGTGTFTNSLTTGTTGSKLLLNNGGAGVTISTTGNGTGNNTISVALVLNDLLTAQVDQVSSASQAGSLNLTAAISGTGSILKQGEGLMTFGTGTKTYTGETVLNGGRTRISNAAHPTATSKFTINAGAQLDLIAAGIYTFGSGPLNLNGSGATSGPYAVFPGAIRNDTGLVITIASPIVLQSDTIIHIQATAGTGGNPNPTGSLTLSNTVQGSGALILTAPGSNPDQGTLFLTNTNSYRGGTIINGGILNAASDAALGIDGGSIQINSLTNTGGPVGILRAGGAITTATRTLVLGVGGGRIDTNGNNVTFAAGSTVMGTTLTKIGAGKLLLAGAQTYDTLTANAGRTDLASALGTGTSTINANAALNISASQTLAALNIGNGAVVTVGAPLPPASQSSVLESGDLSAASLAQAVPEPGGGALLLSGAALLTGWRRRKRA